MFKHLLFILLSISFLSASCGGSGTGSSDTGSISFNVDWDRQSAESLKSAIRASSDVCSDYGIETVNADVINSSSSSVASGSWACSAHSGTISSVPVGSGYTVQLEGLDSGGTVTWRGEITGISVTSGSTSSAGTITMTYIGSDSTPPYIVSFDPSQNETDVPVTTTITATFNEKIAPSTINTDTFTLFDYGTNSYMSGSVTYDASTKTATFTPASNLSYSTQYQAWVHQSTGGVQDMAGWLLTGTSEWYFTTEAAPTSAPSAPTDVSATAGDSQIEITWTASTGATSYNIYYSTTTGVTKTVGTKITGATSPYTHTSLTNGTTYYFVVTAVNSYGESGESSEVSGTPQAATATVQALVVAGGGGGGPRNGGGGGAGGYQYNAAVSVAPGTYIVTVGAGGGGGDGYFESSGSNGGDSSFGSLIVSTGGGGGAGTRDSTIGLNGGSGGGGNYVNTSSGGSGITGQGNPGGRGAGDIYGYGGGGGGGKGAAGGDYTGGPGNHAGNGGDGVSNSISGTSVTYAGGGGGGSETATPGTGGSGGGGNGEYGAGTAGSPNTGGGGGGGGNTPFNGGNGGSGVVIIRYTTGLINATGGTITTTGSDTVHTFTTSGAFIITAINPTG